MGTLSDDPNQTATPACDIDQCHAPVVTRGKCFQYLASLPDPDPRDLLVRRLKDAVADLVAAPAARNRRGVAAKAITLGQVIRLIEEWSDDHQAFHFVTYRVVHSQTLADAIGSIRSNQSAGAFLFTLCQALIAARVAEIVTDSQGRLGDL